MPIPPQPYFAHPFPLQENFTGRVRERRTLTEWLTEDEHPILGLVAIGGMGKSSVAWVWLQRDVLGLPLPGVPPDRAEVAEACRLPEEARPEGVVWWSFYEGGGTFAGFLEAAIAYCSGWEKSAGDYLTESGPTGPSMDYSAMQADVLQLAQQRGFLFVWDGAERLLREYGGQDASMREERDPEEIEPDARDTLEMPVSRFLEQMAGQTRSPLLVVSRLYPRVLDRAAGPRKVELTGLAEDDAVAYLRARGIKGNRAELGTAAGQYEFHPLSLSNLAADLLEDFDEEGDISGAPKYDETENLKAKRHHILERAYERRAPQRRELLSRLSAMRGTIPKEVVQLLAEDIAGVVPENLGRELGELVRHGLLRHPSPEHYDFHPVVRRYCYGRLKERQKTHLRLRDYFDEAPTPEPDEVQSVEDLAQVMELYHHTARAGRYDEACDLMHDRLVPNPLYYRFGTSQTCIELLRGVFPDGEERAPRLKKEFAQAWTLEALALCYSQSGQPRRALRLFDISLAIDEKREHKPGVAISLGNMASQQIALGQLAAGEKSLRREFDIYKALHSKLDVAQNRILAAEALSYLGQFDDAGKALDLAARLLRREHYQQTVCVLNASRALLALLMGDPKAGLKAARETRKLADEVAASLHPVEVDFIRAEWLMGWALVALASEDKSRRAGRLADAEEHLNDALKRCRRISLVDFEPDILLAWARWHRAKGNAGEARRRAEEALAVAERCEYRLKQAEIHNFLSRLALDEGDRKAAREHAKKAYDYALCDGPPDCYKPALEEAEGLLEQAGSG